VAAAGDVVELRAFRGSRRSSVYRAHVVDEADFARIVEAARRRRLVALAALAAAHRLGKQEARALADDVDELRAAVELPELDGELTAIAEVARWCSRAGAEAWLTVERRWTGDPRGRKIRR
jgi:hypothetical protein